jgi:hypothetical protein
MKAGMGIKKDKLSEEQKKEIERLRNFVARNRLASQMNGTKWRAAIDAIQGITGYRASFRVKRLMDAGDPPDHQWDDAFPAHIPLYNSIEWLELNPFLGSPPAFGGKDKRASFREALQRELAAAGIPIVESESGVRIVGYSRENRK